MRLATSDCKLLIIVLSTMPMLAESSISTATVGKPVRRSESVNSAIMNTTIAIAANRSRQATRPCAARPAVAPFAGVEVNDPNHGEHQQTAP